MVAGTGLTVTKNSVGFAYGAGVDYKINQNWSLNFDFKHVDISTNVKVASTGGILTNLDLKPTCFP